MLSLIYVPYHLGRRDAGMGNGPARLRAGGAEALVTAVDPGATVHWLERPTPFEHENGASFAVLVALGRLVRSESRLGRMPIVLGGNCSCAVAAAAGAGTLAEGGVVWFDAHADSHTPDTSTSGFLEGMPVSVLTGRSWNELARGITGYHPLDDDRVLLAGVRAMEAPERRLVDASGLRLVSPDGLAGDAQPFRDELARLSQQAASVHLHVDLDVIDTGDGHANEYAAPGGPSLAQLHRALELTRDHCQVSGISLTSYNPDLDTDGRAADVGSDLLRTLLRVAAGYTAAGR